MRPPRLAAVALFALLAGRALSLAMVLSAEGSRGAGTLAAAGLALLLAAGMVAAGGRP